ncbi:hypothetical protein BKA69DRAFT_1037386 [Paraphysoderma sedebokerense]|nr:hypothetical protein BKA69DRAFT_1037386 [Paraphysoderma sedebokerense]
MSGPEAKLRLVLIDYENSCQNFTVELLQLLRECPINASQLEVHVFANANGFPNIQNLENLSYFRYHMAATNSPQAADLELQHTGRRLLENTNYAQLYIVQGGDNGYKIWKEIIEATFPNVEVCLLDGRRRPTKNTFGRPCGLCRCLYKGSKNSHKKMFHLDSRNQYDVNFRRIVS